MACKEIGYTNGVVMDSSKRNFSAEYNIPRIGIYLYDNLLNFKQKVQNKNKWINNTIQRAIGYCATGTVIVKETL